MLRVSIPRCPKARHLGHPELWVVEMWELPAELEPHLSDKDNCVARVGHPVLWWDERKATAGPSTAQTAKSAVCSAQDDRV